MVHSLGFYLLGYWFQFGCTPKQPQSTLLAVSISPPIGSIGAREEVLRGLMASHNQQWTAAATHFDNAYRFDPHPTILSLQDTLLSNTPLQSVEEP